MTWTTQTFNVGQVLTAAQMTNLNNNFTALANGDSGAPPITLAAMGANSVDNSQMVSGAIHTAEVNTSLGSASTGANTSVDLSGGLYVFLVQLRTSNIADAAYSYGRTSNTDTNVFTNLTSFTTRMILGSDGASTGFIQYRYINTSPPYDLGDGIISTFIFAVVNNTTGEIESISIAPDPVWLHNGPTNNEPEFYVKGVGQKTIIDMEGIPINLDSKERAIALLEAPKIIIPIDQARKNADMNIIPHPFLGDDLTGKTVVIFDPVSGVTLDLAELHMMGEDVNTLIHKKQIVIGNTSLGRASPKDVLDVSLKWKPAGV